MQLKLGRWLLQEKQIKAVTQRRCSICLMNSSVCAWKGENQPSSETEKVAASIMLFLSPLSSSAICLSVTVGLHSMSMCNRGKEVTSGKIDNECAPLLEAFFKPFP